MSFVVRSVFLRFPGWAFRDARELWRLAAACLGLFGALLDGYAPEPGDFRRGPLEDPHPGEETTF